MDLPPAGTPEDFHAVQFLSRLLTAIISDNYALMRATRKSPHSSVYLLCETRPSALPGHESLRPLAELLIAPASADFYETPPGAITTGREEPSDPFPSPPDALDPP